MKAMFYHARVAQLSDLPNGQHEARLAVLTATSTAPVVIVMMKFRAL